VWARLGFWSQVFVDGAVLPRYPDTYYHLRQILRGVESFPSIPVSDPLLNWPHGGFSVWSSGFDWMGAALAIALGGADDAQQAAQIAAFLPILLGLVILGVVMWLARELAPSGAQGARAAICAGLLWAVLPNAVVVSRVGRLDHHVAEVLAMALLGSWVVWAAQKSGARERRLQSWLAFEGIGAAIALWAGLVFNGAVLYVAIAAALLMLLRLTESTPSSGSLLGSGAPALALAGMALAVSTTPVIAEHGHRFDFRYPTFLQPVLYAVAALGCGAAAALSRVFADEPRTLKRLTKRLAVGCAALWVGAGITALATPELPRQVLRGLSEFVARRDPWLAGIGEFQPLFQSVALWRWTSWESLYRIHGVVGLFGPLSLVLGCGLAVRRHRASGLCFAGWTLALVVLTLLQVRFGRLLTVNLAVCTALVLIETGQRLALRWRPIRPAWVAFAAVALCAALDPVTRLGLVWQPARDPSPLESASFYLRSAAGDGGVLAPWEWGNTLMALSGRPVVSAGFGPYVGPEGFREVEASLKGSESDLVALMERRHLAFLATGRSAFEDKAVRMGTAAGPFDGTGAERAIRFEYFRRVPLSPLMLGGGGAAARDVPHVENLMPRFASRERYSELSIPIFRLWLFERVRGARIEGEAPPGARALVRTVLRVRDTSLNWEAWADADSTGHFRIVVPLPNGIQLPPLETAKSYEVWIAETPVASVTLTEEDVREGRTVRVRTGDPEISVHTTSNGNH
jgi:hypothetical protein